MKTYLITLIILIVSITTSFAIDVELTLKNVSEPLVVNTTREVDFEVILKDRSYTPHGKLELFLRKPDGSSERIYYCGGDLCVRTEDWVFADNLDAYVFLAENLSFEISPAIHGNGLGEIIARFTANGTNDVFDSQSFMTVNDTQAPSLVSGLIASDITGNSFTLQWNAATDDVGVADYKLFQNGNHVGNTDQNNYNFGGLTSCTSYTVAVRTVDFAGNQSEPVSITVNTISDDLERVVVLDSDLTNQNFVTVQASEEIALVTGFGFKADSGGDLFEALLTADGCESHSAGRIAPIMNQVVLENKSSVSDYSIKGRLPSLVVYPNPANNKITVDFGEEKFVNLWIISVSGSIVRKLGIYGSEVSIDVSSFKEGQYWLRIVGTDNSSSSTSFIVKH